MANNETAILLLPNVENVAEDARNKLVKTKGVLGVAIHHFDGLPDKHGLGTKRWYAAVTFNNLRVTQDYLKQLVVEKAELTDKSDKIGLVSKGRLANFLQRGNSFHHTGTETPRPQVPDGSASGTGSSTLTTPRVVHGNQPDRNRGSGTMASHPEDVTPNNGGSTGVSNIVEGGKGEIYPPISAREGGGGGSSSSAAEVYNMNDDEEDGGDTMKDELDNWWAAGDSDSDNEPCADYSNQEDCSNEEGVAPSSTSNSKKPHATYLDEELGQPHAVSLFAPLVGVFGMDGAQTVAEHYNAVAMQPYLGSLSEQKKREAEAERAKKKKTWWGSIFGEE